MLQPSSSSIRRHAIAVAGVASATLLTQAVPLLQASSLWLCLVAVVASAWLGGVGAAVTAVVLSLAVELAPVLLRDSASLGAEPAIQSAFFILVSTLVILLVQARRRREDALHQALSRAGARRDLRRTEEELRATEHRFAEFMQHLPGLAWIKDLEGRYIYANDAAIRAFRSRRDELYGKTDDDLFSPETARQFKENDRRALSRENGVLSVETLEHDEEGLARTSIVSKFPIPGPDGRTAWVGGMAIDITDQKRVEAALRAADRRKDEFLATLSHELRNPLAPICTGLELLRAAATSTLEGAQVYEMIERQVRQLVRLIDDLLDLSRINTGKIALRRQPVELAAVVHDAVEASRPQVEGARQTLEVTLPREPIVVEVDRTRLAQALINLLNNASKFTPDGGQIWLTAEREGGTISIRVRDTGIGIPADMLSRVFEMFTQVDRSPERIHGGLGVGLSLVRNLVELHGGSVDAYSPGPGLGSELEVRLPLPPQPPPPATSAIAVGDPALRGGEAEAAPSSGLRILVVDDNPDAVESLATLLSLQGHEVATAHDGPGALTAASTFRPEVMLLDIGLPGMNGYEVATKLREQQEARDLVLIAITGWGQDEDRRRSQEAGFQHHLVKPVAVAELERLLATLR